MAPSKRSRPQPPARQVSWTTPDAGPVRARVETASRTLLVRLHDLPRWVLFVVVTALAVVGAVLPGWAGGACLLVIATLVGWLVYLAWPGLTPGRRAMRVLVVAAVLGAVVVRVVSG